MERSEIKTKIKRYELSRDTHIKEGRPVSAEMDNKVVVALKVKLVEARVGDAK